MPPFFFKLRNLINKETLVWATIWIIVTGISNLFLIPNGFTYVKEPAVISLFFLTAAGFGAEKYKLINKPYLINFPIKNTVTLLTMALFFFCLSRLIKSATPLAAGAVASLTEEKLQLPEFSIAFWISKFAEIVFQQTYILGLIRLLLQNAETKKHAAHAFAAFFTLIHIPLIFILGWTAFYFIIPSLFAGYIFSGLILNYKNGVIYSYAVHIGFYLLLGTFLRIRMM